MSELVLFYFLKDSVNELLFRKIDEFVFSFCDKVRISFFNESKIGEVDSKEGNARRVGGVDGFPVVCVTVGDRSELLEFFQKVLRFLWQSLEGMLQSMHCCIVHSRDKGNEGIKVVEFSEMICNVDYFRDNFDSLFQSCLPQNQTANPHCNTIASLN